LEFSQLASLCIKGETVAEECCRISNGRVTDIKVPEGVDVKCTLPRCSMTRS